MKSNPSDIPVRGAGLSLWERINRDPNYLEAKRRLQARYGLPLPFDVRLDDRKWLDWMSAGEKTGNKYAKRGRAFLKDVHALFRKYEVPETWYSEFIADIAGLSVDNTLEEWSIPKINVYSDSDGNLKWECIITPETDLTNPLILALIQRGQKDYAGDPPKPAKDKNRPRRFDWHPVYEWHKRHPLFTIEEIAEKINYAPQTVRRKFSALENRN